MSEKDDKKGGTDVLDRDEAKEKIKKPRKYKVILLNDDFTPMDFVVQVLKRVFHMSSAAATQAMLNIHNQGADVAGIYSREIAETKAAQAMAMAQSEGHPLQSTIEPE